LPRSVPAAGRNLNSYNKNGLFSRGTALAGLVNDGRLTPTVAAIESLPAGAAQSAKTGPAKTVLTLV